MNERHKLLLTLRHATCYQGVFISFWLNNFCAVSWMRLIMTSRAEHVCACFYISNWEWATGGGMQQQAAHFGQLLAQYRRDIPGFVVNKCRR